MFIVSKNVYTEKKRYRFERLREVLRGVSWNFANEENFQQKLRKKNESWYGENKKCEMPVQNDWNQ